MNKGLVRNEIRTPRVKQAKGRKMERLGQVWRASWGLTRASHKSAEDFHKEALDYEKQGGLDKAQACYIQALRATEKLNSTESKVCRTLARIHLDYACLLEKQRNVVEAGNAYQQAQRYGLDAYRLESDQAEAQVLLQNIGLCHSKYLLSQRQSAQSEKVLQETVQLVKENAAKQKASPDEFLHSINNSISTTHRPNFSLYPDPFSIRANNPEGKIVVQNCQGTINAPVHGKNNTVTVHYYSPNSKARQPHAVSLGSLRNALYQHYQLSNLSIQRVSGDQMSLADCYINLAIVESQAQREKDKEELKKQAVAFERLPSSERQQLESTNPNKLIALEKLFEAQKLRDGSEGVPKRILIQGRAGIGKTTLCKKLVYEYHHNGLWQDRFESLLWVPLRQLKTHSPKRLEDLLCNQYFVGYESRQAQALSEVFHAQQDKTLFILDGLDEVIGELDERSPFRALVQNLLTQAHVVITSRPAGVETSLLGQLDLELETVGFSPDNVQAYIEKFVPESNQAAIQQFINQNPLIQGLVNIPIQLDALCYSWDHLPKDPKKTITMSMLYEAMVDKLWRKDGVRLEKQDKGKTVASNVIQSSSKPKLEKLMEGEIHYLGYLAFKGLEEGKIEFNAEELDQYQAELEDKFPGKEFSFSFTDDLKKTSFLHTADVQRPEAERHYHFLHLTFQEFFAAKFLARHLQTDTNVSREFASAEISHRGLSASPSQADLQAFIAQHKYNPRYQIVWWMVAGLLKGTPLEQDTPVKHFFTFLEQAPRDLIGVRHQQVVMGCLSEARDHLDPKRVGELEKELMQWFHFEMKLSGKSTLGRQRIFPEHLLLKLLDQPDDRKVQIIETLGARPTLSEAAELALSGACQHENKDIRYAAASALGSKSTLSEAAVLALIGACQHENKDVRSAAASALGGKSTVSEAAVLALIGACQHKNGNVRSAAARALGGKSTLSEAAVLALIGACQHKNGNVRSVAARALGGQSTLSKAAVLALIGACQDQDSHVRSEAAHALGGKSMLSEAAVLALIGVCQDENKDVRSAAARALGGQSTLSEVAMLTLIDACQDREWNVRYAAANALGGKSTLSEAAVLALIGVCQDEDSDVRSAAASALGGQNTLSEVAVLALIGACQHENRDVRSAAARALGGRSTLSEAAVLALIGACQHKNGNVRYAAASALGSKSTLSEAAVLALSGVCQDEDSDVRYVAARALGDQSTLSEVAELALIGACQHEDSDVRSEAVSALGGQSTLSEVAELALIGVCQDENKDVRYAAASALRDQSTLSEAAVLALIGVCQDEDSDVRYVAARALGGQSTLSEVAMLALSGACQHEDSDVRSEAAHALGGKSTLSEAAVLALIGVCQDENKDVRSAAARALGGQSTLSEVAMLTLIDACQDREWNVRYAAANALGGKSTLSEAAVLALIGVCQDEDSDVRSAAASALGGQNTLSEVAVLALIGACQDENRDVRSAAARALGGQSTLSEATVLALTGACQHKNGNVRSAAARALGGQSTLSEAAVLALIDALQDQYSDVRDAVVGILDLHIDQIYLMFASLAPEQIQTLYAKFLLPRSGKQMMFLYVQGNRLYFHTKSGLNHIELALSEKMNVLIDAFKAVRNDVMSIPDSFALIDNAIERNIIQGYVSDSDESHILNEDSFWESESESADFSEEEELTEAED